MGIFVFISGWVLQKSIFWVVMSWKVMLKQWHSFMWAKSKCNRYGVPNQWSRNYAEGGKDLSSPFSINNFSSFPQWEKLWEKFLYQTNQRKPFTNFDHSEFSKTQKVCKLILDIPCNNIQTGRRGVVMFRIFNKVAWSYGYNTS